MYSSIRPGKVWYDTEGKRIHAHGGSILYAENIFWWYGENKEGITGTATGEQCKYRHHGIRCYSSTDLYNWDDEGIIVPESNDEANPLFPTYIVERPHILYNEKNGNYVLWAKTTKSSYKEARFSICVGDSLHTFKYLHDVDTAPHYAGDFDLFVENGHAYIIFEHPHSEMIIRELNDDYTDFNEKWSSHLRYEYPPLVREAPAHFTHNGKNFILTSGTTGYYPNPTITYDITDLHGEWKELGKTCQNDIKNNSFHAQFSSVFHHPNIPDLYIAIGDRWLTDLVEDLPDMEEMYHDRFSPDGQNKFDWSQIKILSDLNTSEANYLWLPIKFDDSGTPYIEWLRSWMIEDYRKEE